MEVFHYHGFWGLVILILDIWALVHVFGSNRTESNLQGVAMNPTTRREMNKIHAACKKFIGS